MDIHTVCTRTHKSMECECGVRKTTIVVVVGIKKRVFCLVFLLGFHLVQVLPGIVFNLVYSFVYACVGVFLPPCFS